jgi:PKHD-type hydroxylase
MPKHLDLYQIPTAINKKIADDIIDEIHNSSLSEAQLSFGEISTVNTSIRNSKIQWISADSWISGMMAHFIHSANMHSFEYDLTGWAERIQYTVYEGKGSHYGWHFDTKKSSCLPNTIRKLSISLCLTSKDDYEGGEFEILIGNKPTTFKMNCGDAIIFPADCLHRVRPLKSGKRISLVGWYGGPKFK